MSQMVCRGCGKICNYTGCSCVCNFVNGKCSDCRSGSTQKQQDKALTEAKKLLDATTTKSTQTKSQ